MNYKKVYDQLIEHARKFPPTGYTERHHIIPKSEGGSNDKENIIPLSARQHYIAHLLLSKIYNDLKMYSAVLYMRCSSPDNKRDFKFNSRLYEKMRDEFAKRISIRNKGRTAWNKGRPFTEETRRNMSIAHQGQKPTAETRKRMSESHMGIKFPESRKRNIAEGRRGSRWITNGVVEIHFHGSELPIGFHYGRKKKDPLK